MRLKWLVPILVTTSTFAASSNVVLKKKTGGTVTRPDIIFYTGFENDSVCDVYTFDTAAPDGDYPGSFTGCLGAGCTPTAGTCSAVDPGAAVTAGSVKIGSYGLHIQGCGGPCTDWETVNFAITADDIITPGEGCLGFYAYRTGTTAENALRTQGGTGNISCGWGGAEVTCTYTDGTTDCAGVACAQTLTSTGSAVPSAGSAAWRFIEFCWDATADTTRMRIFDDAGQVGSDYSAATPAYSAGSAWTILTLGATQNTAAIDGYYDNLMISNDSAEGFSSVRASSAPRGSGGGGSDSTAPEAITDLAAGSATSSTCALTWTAPHEDGASGGSVASYDCRVCTQASCSTTMDGTEYGAATLLTGEPGSPGAPGAFQTFTATGLAASTAYVFGCISTDDNGNTSAISNSGTCTTGAAGAFNDIVFWNNFESGAVTTPTPYTMTTSGAAKECSGTSSCTAGDTTGLLQGSFDLQGDIDVNGACAVVGSQGLRFNDIGGVDNSPQYIAYAVSSSDIVDEDEGSIGFWFNASASTSRTMFQASFNGSNRLIASYTSGRIGVEYIDGGVSRYAESGVALSVSTNYFVEFKWNTTIDQLTVKTTTVGGTTTTRTACPSGCDQTIGAFTNTNAWVNLYVGVVGGGTGGVNGCVDNIMISNDDARDLTAIRNDVASPR